MAEHTYVVPNQTEQVLLAPDVAYAPATHAGFPYNFLTAEGIAGATSEAIRLANERVEAIVASDDVSWEAVLGGLNVMVGERMQATNRQLFMANVHPDKKTRDAAVAAKSAINGHTNDVLYRADLYARLKSYAETPEAQELEGEEARYLQFKLTEFWRAGHDLDAASRDRTEALNRALKDDATAFDENLRESKTRLVFTAKDLEGMSDAFLSGLAQDENGNYIVTTNNPHVVPLLQKAKNRNTRQKVHFAYNTRAIDTNRAVLEDAVEKRQEFAGIMGYDSWAQFKLQERMAKTPEAVSEFYAELMERIVPKASAELAALQQMLHDDGHEGPIRDYDISYYINKISERNYGVDQEKVAEYFPLDATLKGLFEITSETFGVQYRRLDIPTWHEDVMAFAIDDTATGEQIAVFYMDLFPREGKYSHAAVFPLQKGRELPDGTYCQPESAIVANFTKPTAGRPSLLKYSEAKTLFHEFGHILHHTLTRAKFAEFSGTANVERDFVEAPSKIMEHWLDKPEILQRFTKHYQTGESLPAELLEGLLASRQLGVAYTTLRQFALGHFDIAIHNDSPEKDLDTIVRNLAAMCLTPYEEGTFFPAGFVHMFHNYDAGYYGYQWANVFGDDMFTRFEREGLTNPDVGADYRRNILEKGGTVDAIDMLRAFLGREPNNAAYLRNKGILAAKTPYMDTGH